MYGVGQEDLQRRILGIGNDGIFADAWGRQKVVFDHSMWHGLFTFDVPDKMWIEFINGVESPKTNATSLNGMLKLVSNGGTSYLMSKRHPRYQPNRGLLYSNSLMIDNATLQNGKLYAVVRTTVNGTIYNDKKEVSYSNYDPAYGNIYDIQMQWRGVGDIKFFYNQKQIATFDYLENLAELSVSNPSLPIAFECTNQGIIRFGLFNEGNGIFFQWEFTTPQNTQLRCGCVDVSSEGGFKENRQYVSTATSSQSGSISVTGYNQPVLAIRIPNLFKGKMNTRDAVLTRITGYSDQKSVMRVWYTRNGVGVLTGTWTPINGGNIESSELLTINTAQLNLIYSNRIQIDDSTVVDNPDQNYGDFFLIHGDYIIVTIHRENGSGANVGATIELSEEI